MLSFLFHLQLTALVLQVPLLVMLLLRGADAPVPGGSGGSREVRLASAVLAVWVAAVAVSWVVGRDPVTSAAVALLLAVAVPLWSRRCGRLPVRGQTVVALGSVVVVAFAAAVGLWVTTSASPVPGLVVASVLTLGALAWFGVTAGRPGVVLAAAGALVLAGASSATLAALSTGTGDEVTSAAPETERWVSGERLRPRPTSSWVPPLVVTDQPVAADAAEADADTDAALVVATTEGAPRVAATRVRGLAVASNGDQGSTGLVRREAVRPRTVRRAQVSRAADARGSQEPRRDARDGQKVDKKNDAKKPGKKEKGKKPGQKDKGKKAKRGRS